MDAKVGIALGVAALLILAKPAGAAQEFVCPYGDNLVFDTLAALQEHVIAVHPGQRVPITIIWG